MPKATEFYTTGPESSRVAAGLASLSPTWLSNGADTTDLRASSKQPDLTASQPLEDILWRD
jgi:hypothetical protein